MGEKCFLENDPRNTSFLSGSLFIGAVKTKVGQ